MKKIDLTTKTAADMDKMLADKREALRVFRFEGAGSRARNVRGGRALRREIARIMTELCARELAPDEKSA